MLNKTKKIITISLKNSQLKEIIYQKMSNKVKDIDKRNRTYYFFNDIMNIKNFDPNNIKIDKKS